MPNILKAGVKQKKGGIDEYMNDMSEGNYMGKQMMRDKRDADTKSFNKAEHEYDEAYKPGAGSYAQSIARDQKGELISGKLNNKLGVKSIGANQLENPWEYPKRNLKNASAGLRKTKELTDKYIGDETNTYAGNKRKRTQFMTGR